MSDDDKSEEPAVTLGAKQAVEGAPLARVTARLMWGIEQSAIREREGETLVRTPEGPTELGELLDNVDTTYFSTRQEFESAVREVIGDGPVPTQSSSSEDEAANEETEGEAATDETTAGEDSESAD